jgi:hypothetical protein
MVDGIGSNLCMFDKSDKCGGTYSFKDIQKVIGTGEQFEKWDEMVRISEIFKMASICDDYIICPLCLKWGCIFEIPTGYNGNFFIKCGACSQEFCNVCKRKAHGKRSCNELVFDADESMERRLEIIDKRLEDIVTKATTHNCTICGTSYVKIEGCNLIQCAKCGGLSCYLCNMKLYIRNNTKYWHFTGHELADRDAKCPLWNNRAGDGKENQGNTEFNQSKVQEQLVEFILCNLSTSINSGDLIVSRIEKMFEKDKEYSNFVGMIKELMVTIDTNQLTTFE